MGKEFTLDRRTFLKAVVFGAASVCVPFLGNAEASPFTEPSKEKDPNLIKLETYLTSLKSNQQKLLKVIENNDIFAGFKSFTTEERIDDFNRYHPIYKAVEEKLNIPWPLLWIMHAAETTVSRDKNSNQGECYGAMQVNRGNRGLENPAAGWEFLSLLPNQRYPDDWEEIFRGGLYIRKIADNIKKSQLNISDEDAVLDVVRYSYSAVQYGKTRANLYLKTKSLFDIPKQDLTTNFIHRKLLAF